MWCGSVGAVEGPFKYSIQSLHQTHLLFVHVTQELLLLFPVSMCVCVYACVCVCVSVCQDMCESAQVRGNFCNIPETSLGGSAFRSIQSVATIPSIPSNTDDGLSKFCGSEVLDGLLNPEAVNCFVINWLWSLADSDFYSSWETPARYFASFRFCFLFFFLWNRNPKLTTGKKVFNCYVYSAKLWIKSK